VHAPPPSPYKETREGQGQMIAVSPVFTFFATPYGVNKNIHAFSLFPKVNKQFFIFLSTIK